MQQLTTNLVIDIPSDLILINKTELVELTNKTLEGTYWSMKDLEKRVNRKHEWIKENILYPSRFRKILDVEEGGCAFYPQSKGQTWSFHAPQMARFLDDHFTQIFAQNKYLN